MKRNNLIILYIVLTSFILAWGSIRIEKFEKKKIKNNIVYIELEDTPFSGKLEGENISEEYKNGIKNGVFKGEFIDEGQKFLYEGKYIEGIKHGVWTIKYPTGERRAVLEYDYDKPCGQWKYYYKGNKLEAFENFEKGVLSGEMKVFNKEGIEILKTTYHNGLLNGRFISYYSKNIINTVTNFSYGKLNGSIKVFTEDGTLLLEGKYIEDRREDVWKLYYSSGEIKTKVSYKLGKKHGESIIYDKNGMVMEKTIFNNGIEEGSKDLKPKNNINKDKLVSKFKKFNRELRYEKYDDILSKL